MSRVLSLTVTVLILAVSASACSDSDEATPTSTKAPVPTATTAPTETPLPTDTPTETPTPEPTPTPGPLSAEEIFNTVGPTIAFVETPIGSGSGLTIEGSYIVTNAHVVWPFQEARIVYSDGAEHVRVPVVSWDLLADIAILGPIEGDEPQMAFVDGETLAVGSEVYLIGYPGEVDEFPEPTITRGLISRVREWEPGQITYFQTDASIGGGQSGGVMVTEYGEIIGISGMSFSDAKFGLVASGIDLAARVQGLLEGEDVSGLGSRTVPSDGGKREYEHIYLSHSWDTKVFVINEPVGTEIELEAAAEHADLAIEVVDPAGYWVTYSDEGFRGRELSTFTTDTKGPYFVYLTSFTPNATGISLNANRNLIPFVDLDDGHGLAPGSSILGSIDFPGDVDYFNLILEEGERINILVDSIMIDPYLDIDRPGYWVGQTLGDDDTGGGVFGTNSEISFIAPDAGRHLLIIQDAFGYNTGGYSIDIREMYSGAPTPMAPELIQPPIETEAGPMVTYESNTGPYSIDYPATWSAVPAMLGPYGEACDSAMITACFGSGEGDLLMITEEDLSSIGIDVSQEEYVNLVISTLVEGLELVAREEFVTDDGLSAVLLQINFQNLFDGFRFIFVHDDQAFNATYIIATDPEAFQDVIEHTFRSFELQ